MPEMKVPDWASFAKTGSHKERPPQRDDWWYVRAASILRKIYRYGPIGVSKLRVKYGGRKNRGHKPDKFIVAGGNNIRKILQQLDTLGFTKQDVVAKRKGRVITPKGKSFLDKLAIEIQKSSKTSKKPKKEVVITESAESEVEPANNSEE